MLIHGCLYAQFNDPQFGDPPISIRPHDFDRWRPLNAKPFEGCDIIVNRDWKSGKLTIGVQLKNLGYGSTLELEGSAVYVRINCVADNYSAMSMTSVLLPEHFDLYVIIDNCDTAVYIVDYEDNDLRIEAGKTSENVNIVSLNKAPRPLCWIQFRGSNPSLIENIHKTINCESCIEVLEKGYYLNFPVEVNIKHARKRSYNRTYLGAIIFLRRDNDSFEDILNRLIAGYTGKEMVGYGFLDNKSVSRE